MMHLKRENLNAALQATNYRIYGAGVAAEILGVKSMTLASRIKALQILLRPRAQTRVGGN
jgi:transcriptional regulator with GAF, ATPase, and Fis domain